MDINDIRLAQIKSQLCALPIRNRQLGRADEQVARNLHSMLADAEARGICKKGIVHRAIRTDSEGQAQKQLDKLTVPPAISAEKLPHRLARLQRKPQNYVSVAHEWAAKMGWTEEDAILRLFDGTDYGWHHEPDEDDYNPVASIAGGLRQIAQKVATTVDLQTFWQRLLETPGRYDPRVDRIIPAAQGIVVEGGGLKGNAICVDEMSPIASVSLLRRLQQRPITGEIWMDPVPEPNEFDPRLTGMPYLSPVGFVTDDGGKPVSLVPLSSDGSNARAFSHQDMVRHEAQFLHWLDIRLAVGPQADCAAPISSDIGPLIELRTMFEATINGQRLIFDNPFHDGSAVVQWALFGDRWHRVSLGNWKRDVLPRIDTRFFYMPEHWYFAWGELSRASLEHVLGTEILPNSPGEEIDPSRYFTGIATEPMLRAIERRISEGLAEELFERAIYLRQMVRDHRATSKNAFEQHLDNALQTLSRKGALLQTNDKDSQ